jgi:transcriptional regulator with GAF, ATPase, and Fis domain
MPTGWMHDAWREVSRHLEIAASAPTLQAILREAMGARWLVIRRVEAEHNWLRTVAAAGLADDTRTPLPSPLAAALQAWTRAGRVDAWQGRGENRISRAVVPEGATGPVVAAPIADESGGFGAAVLVGVGSDRRADVAPFVEAVAVALANDARLAELARLREAAEADRRALLDRLGRTDIVESIVGADGGLAGVLARVDMVARTDVAVLLLGETGSGKEVVARAIHDRSLRHAGPFLRVNCGAIPGELVDSELFGHERGAFTGAVATRRGWFERADGGTLLLDEVGELPPAAQVRLLRVLQDGSFSRVGGQAPLHCDVRVVAATHRDLPGMVRQGAFRQDLWYRLSAFPLSIPPLRERPGDLAALATHFAARAGRRLFGRELPVSDGDVRLLRAQRWPGNVRELASVVERAAILGDGRRLEVRGALIGHGRPMDDADLPVDQAEIERVLGECHGRIEGPFGAGARLGINPHTLRSRMRKLGIDWARFRPA